MGKHGSNIFKKDAHCEALFIFKPGNKEQPAAEEGFGQAVDICHQVLHVWPEKCQPLFWAALMRTSRLWKKKTFVPISHKLVVQASKDVIQWRQFGDKLTSKLNSSLPVLVNVSNSVIIQTQAGNSIHPSIFHLTKDKNYYELHNIVHSLWTNYLFVYIMMMSFYSLWIYRKALEQMVKTWYNCKCIGAIIKEAHSCTLC